ncbi:MAG: acetate kinase, partial [Pseudomonadota bacterium]
AVGGLDALIFTAGIGENAGEVRHQICQRLTWMGLELDSGRNNRNAARISADTSTVDALVIPTNEELVIAKAVRALSSH